MCFFVCDLCAIKVCKHSLRLDIVQLRNNRFVMQVIERTSEQQFGTYDDLCVIPWGCSVVDRSQTLELFFFSVGVLFVVLLLQPFS